METDSDDFLLDPIKKSRYRKQINKTNEKIQQKNRKRGRPKKIHPPGVEPQKWKRPTGRFKCPHCVKYFTRSYRVNIHVQLRHGFQCKSCDARYTSYLHDI